jgi:hypothetical protein
MTGISSRLGRFSIGAIGFLSLGVAMLQPLPAAAKIMFGDGAPAYGYVASPPYYPYVYPAFYSPYSGSPHGNSVYIGFGGYHFW